MSSVSSDLLPFPFLCPSLFFFCFFSLQFCFELGSRLESLFPDEAAQLNDGARVNPTINTKLFIALAAAAAAQQHRNATGHSVCRATESDESRSTRSHSQGFTEEGLLNRKRLFFAPGWINKRPLRYLHPHKDKTTSRRKRIMGSGDPS